MTDAHPDSGHPGHEHPPDNHDHDHDHDHDHGNELQHDEGSGHGHRPGVDHDHQHPSGIMGFVLSLLRPHGHDAADSVDSALEASTEGIRAVKISLVALGVTALALLITVAILAVLRGAARDIYRRLMDAVDPDLVDAAEAAVRDVPGVRSVDSVQLRWIGHRMRAEITLTVDDTLGIVKAHTIADEAQHQLIHLVPRLDDATVHVNPSIRPGIDHHTATGHHRTWPPTDA